MKSLFELLYKRLYFFAIKYVKEHQVAEDIVQEAFLKLWKNWDERHNLPQIKSYLYTIIKHDCLNFLAHLRHTQKQLAQQPSIPDSESSHQWRMIEAEVIGEVKIAIEKLPPKCREIFMLSYQEEYSNQQIADILHLSLQTVKNQKSRGYRILRSMLKNALPFFL
jgi:RNA polymerase sigma-70 factor (ECF subfamily)